MGRKINQMTVEAHSGAEVAILTPKYQKKQTISMQNHENQTKKMSAEEIMLGAHFQHKLMVTM